MPFEHFTPGEIYTNNQVLDGILQDGLSPQNPAAFTYNRWNRGMTIPQPFFEYLGRDRYKFIGEVSYFGPVFNDPKGGVERQIAQWDGRKYNFLKEELRTFEEWKNSNFEGVATISVGCKIWLKTNGKESRCVIRNENMHDGYVTINPSSNLAQELLGKKIGDKIHLGPSIIEVLEIS
jgi:hypothetical protein